VYGTEKYNLKSQGIFQMPLTAKMHHTPPSVWLGWGLSRNGKWVFIRVDFTLIVNRSPADEYEQANAVFFEETTLQHILESVRVHPYRIWLQLHKAVTDWVAFRKLIYEKALAIKTSIEVLRGPLELLYKIDESYVP
jgi:hypothetical protein